MAFPEGAQENLKSVVHHSRREPASPTCLINSTGISVLTAMPPTMATVQNVGMGAAAESQTQAVILLPSGCHAADTEGTESGNRPRKISWGGLPIKFAM